MIKGFQLRVTWLAALLVALGALLLGACTSEKPGPSPTPTETAAGIVLRAADRMDQVKSLHFRMDSTGAPTMLVPGLAMNSAEGELAKPDKLKVTVNAKAGAAVMEVKIVAMGDATYMTNPIGGRWQALPMGYNPIAFFDPKTGISGIMRAMKDPERAGEEAIDGINSLHIKGNVDSAALVPLTGTSTPGFNIKAELWVGKEDLLVRQVRLEGRMSEAEAENIARILKLSKFDETPTIEAPL